MLTIYTVLVAMDYPIATFIHDTTHSLITECITGFAEIFLKSLPGFKLLGRDKNAVKTKVAGKITQFYSR